MKKLLNNYPNLSRYALAIVLFGFSLFISGMVNKGAVKEFFPYSAVILLLLCTWILYRSEGKSLNAIGLGTSLRNLVFLPFGLLLGSLAFLGSQLIKAWYLGETIELSTSLDYSVVFLALYFILPQVATEELLFRGYLFQKTATITSVVIANVIFSILFMLIHVVDEEVLSNRGMLILMAVTIPVGHLLFATALVKSKTLLFPIGIHLGNNWATRHLISNGSEADSLFIMSNTTNFDTWTPFLVMIFLTNGFFLLVTFLIWRWDRIVLLFSSRNHENQKH